MNHSHVSDILVRESRVFLRNDVLNIDGSSGCVVVNLLACGASGTGFDSRSRRYDFRDGLFRASKLRSALKIAKAT